MRRCADCQLCCKLLPMDARERGHQARAAMIKAGLATPELLRVMRPEFDKPANTRCPHQRAGKGCVIYSQRPFSCRVWACRWLVEDDTADLRRPDRSHYVLDIMPDFVTMFENATGRKTHIPVVVIWVDPDFPDAHRDPALRADIERRYAENGSVGLVRLSSVEGFTLIPPALADDKKWHEPRPPPGFVPLPEHTVEDRLEAIGPMNFQWANQRGKP
jgi:hypothetical protein